MASTRSIPTPRISRAVGLLITAGMIAGGTAAAIAFRPAGLSGAGDIPTVQIDASWAYGYGSLAELTNAADLVVVGRVGEVLSDGPDQETPSVGATTYRLNIDTVIKGVPAGAVVIKQTGGTVNGVRQIVADDPMMNVGERFVFYLQRVAKGPYVGDYSVLGGPQGRLPVSATGGLTSLGGVPLPPGATVDSLTSN